MEMQKHYDLGRDTPAFSSYRFKSVAVGTRTCSRRKKERDFTYPEVLNDTLTILQHWHVGLNRTQMDSATG
jgi:hypothetical protein